MIYKYCIAGAIGFGICFIIFALGLSQGLNFVVQGHSITCYQWD